MRSFAVTNFYLSDCALGGWPCWRYDTVTRMLAADATAATDRIAELLEAASHPATRYSVVCDLVRGELRLSYAHDFDRWATIDVAALCEIGSERVSVEELVDGAE